jgi:hypothetical protein
MFVVIFRVLYFTLEINQNGFLYFAKNFGDAGIPIWAQRYPEQEGLLPNQKTLNFTLFG